MDFLSPEAPDVLYKKRSSEKFHKFTGKDLSRSLFLKHLLKVRLRHCCFPVNFTKFLLTTVL